MTKSGEADGCPAARSDALKAVRETLEQLKDDLSMTMLFVHAIVLENENIPPEIRELREFARGSALMRVLFLLETSQNAFAEILGRDPGTTQLSSQVCTFMETAALLTTSDCKALQSIFDRYTMETLACSGGEADELLYDLFSSLPILENYVQALETLQKSASPHE